MTIIVKDRQINFMVNSENYEKAKKVFKGKGLDISTAFNEFVKEVAVTQDLPFKTSEEQERDRLIFNLQNEISSSYQKLREDKGLTLEDARKAILN